MPELAFFLGKGGVGKTTLSAAYAVRAARQKHSRPVLLISTDPAHSLGDVFQVRLQAKPVEVKAGSTGKLRVWELDSAALFRDFLNEHRAELIATIESGSFFTRKEGSDLLETTLPGMAEIAALLAIQSTVESGRYSTIVVDTAPFGHTLRLFSLPEQFLRLLNFLELAGERDQVLAQHFGGRISEWTPNFVNEWRARLHELRKSLSAANLFLVTTPESFALNESVRCMAELRETNPEIELAGIILNRVAGGTSQCAVCRGRAKASRRPRSFLRAAFPGIDVHVVEDPGSPILGVQALRHLAQHVFSHAPIVRSSAHPKSGSKSYGFEPAYWPAIDAPLSFVVGKGGVGKTTISAGLGFQARACSQDAVEICSVDPAPSLDDIFQTPVGNDAKSVLGDKKFRASELDSVALFQQWISSLRWEVEQATTANVSGVHIDLSFERKLFSELLELVPPGVDEVLSVFRIIDLMGQPARKVIIDMAPSGHALELLRTPDRMLAWSRLLLKSLAAHRKLALAREAAVKIAELEVRARELSQRLRSSQTAKAYVVTLPELLPDRETGRLLTQLESLGLPIEAVFINRVLLPEMVAGCSRCRSQAEWQAKVLTTVKREFGDRQVYMIPEFRHELSGRKGLRQLTQQLWRLS
ncbi:MAG TPA: ArsA family ATPase [Terriglobales bacterium]